MNNTAQESKLESILKKYDAFKSKEFHYQTSYELFRRGEDILQGINFIIDYYMNPEIKGIKREFTNEMIQVYSGMGHGKRASKVLAKATPLPIDNKAGKYIIAGAFGLLIGRISYPDIKTVSKVAGIDEKMFINALFFTEYALDVASGFQNTFTYAAGDTLFQGLHSLKEWQKKLVFGIAYGISREIYTFQSHRRFIKTDKYSPDRMMPTTLLGLIEYTTSAWHGWNLQKKLNGNNGEAESQYDLPETIFNKLFDSAKFYAESNANSGIKIYKNNDTLLTSKPENKETIERDDIYKNDHDNKGFFKRLKDFAKFYARSNKHAGLKEPWNYNISKSTQILKT